MLKAQEAEMRNPMMLDGGVGSSGGSVRRGLLGLLVLIMIAIVAASSTSCVRTGHVGVITQFGRVTGRTIGEGIHLVNPVSRVNEMDVKTLEIKERASVPTKEGLIMGVEASVLYHLQPDRAAEVYQRIGTDYANVLPVPNFPSPLPPGTPRHSPQ